jgi:hypothetical protein
MWDTMESVWISAKDDPRCDTYVIPIPYYDLLPGRVPGAMHYEGDLYPEYVPIPIGANIRLQTGIRILSLYIIPMMIPIM